MKPATARTLASTAVLTGFLPVAFLHLAILWIARIPHTAFEPGAPRWPLLALTAATALVGLLPLLLLAPALFSLLRRAYPSLRRGLKAWLFPPALLLAILVPCAWPFALLAPAARRLGGRSACALALSGGAVFLLPVLAALLVLLPANPLPFSLHYPALLLSALATALLLAALAKTAPSRRATRALSTAFAILVLLSLATQPAILFRPVLRARADTARGALVAATGTSLRPDAPYPSAIPPVPPDADPIAALDRSAIRDQYHNLATVTASLTPPIRFDRPLFRLHPCTPEETARVADALSAAPDLAAAAEAFSAPAYRSSRPGGATPGDGIFLEPEVENALEYVRFLSWRAALAARSGDLPALRADLDRIANGAAIAAREPCVMGPLLVASHFKLPFASSAIQSGLPLLPDDALDDLARTADSLSALVDSLRSDCIAGETFFMARNVFAETWPDGTPRPPVFSALSFFPPSWRECLDLCTQIDIYRYYAALAAEIPCNPDPAAFQAALQRAEDRLEMLPVFAAVVAIVPKDILSALLVPRDIATLLRTATAIERHRRARGTLPATLADLVPDFLPALPLESFTGAPLSYQPGPVTLPEEPLRFTPSRSPDAPPPVVLPPATLPGYLLTLPSSRPDRPPSPLFFPTP